MKRIVFPALLLAMGLTTAPLARADRYYYEDEPMPRHRVHVERRYVERVYHPDEERVYYRDDRPRYILPPGPHRIIQHFLFGDPWY